MRFHVRAVALCHNCPAEGRSRTKLFEEVIVANDDQRAKLEFKRKYRLCRQCEAKGTKVELSFDEQQLACTYIGLEPFFPR